MCEISSLQLKISDLSAKLISLCEKKQLTFGTAESCTGGLISAAITGIPGASAVFWGGVVSYDNRIKNRILGVKNHTLQTFGAVSAQTAKEMARGAVKILGTTLAVSVTGIAGPGGGTPQKPVGLVYLAVATNSGQILCRKGEFQGDRAQIRLQTVAAALDLLIFAVENLGNSESFDTE